MPNEPFAPDSFQTFGDLLKYLRRRERLTQLELSIMVGYSEAQMTRLEKNQRRPDPIAVKALFIPALHLENEPHWIARLLELAQSAWQEDAPVPGFAPYKGLLFFDELDTELFFGRETLTSHLIDRVCNLEIDSPLRFLAVVGASGSGKSSLVRAGLSAELKRDGWDVYVLTPGVNPARALEAQLALHHAEAAPDRVLILIDQFEETFTLCHDEAERLAFIENLLSLAQDTASKTTVVIALRADFYSHCAQYPSLRQAVAAEQEYIGQMSPDELRRAIEEPARRGGWEFEAGLVDLLLNEVGATGTGQPEPGGLPLLSHALLATWERRRGRLLTLEGYRASGGVRGAIAETAESVFKDQLNQTQQEIARDVFLRLTELGEGTEDTRRRASLNELVRQSAEATQLRTVLNTLAEARLVTLNEDSAEVAHEALIREWQRLHEWLTQDREGLLLHRHLTESAYEWEARQRDTAELYRGARLAQTREWAASHPNALNAAEKAFLEASEALEQRQLAEWEALQRRELEAAQELAEMQRRVASRLRIRNRVITAVGVIAIVLAIVALFFSRQSNINAEDALVAKATAQAASTQALADFTHSEAQRLAVEANNIKLNNGDANLVALLAIRSLQMQYTSSGDAVLTSLTALEAPPLELRGHTDKVFGVAFSPDGKYLASGSGDGTARLWELATGETIHIFEGRAGEVGEVQFSPDGKYLAVSSTESTQLWDIVSGQEVQVFSGIRGGTSAAFSPDAKYIVTSSFNDKNSQLWDVATGQSLYTFQSDGEVIRVAYSPDGKYVLTGSVNYTAQLWDPATGDEIKTFAISSGIESLTFSPDSTSIAFGNSNGNAQIWSINTGELIREFSGPEGFVQGIKFSPDGQTLLTGSADRAVRLWEVDTGQLIRVLGAHSAGVQGVAFSSDGRFVATASEDKTARLWSLQTFPGGIELNGNSGPIWQASFSPDGKRVITASDNGTAHIWDATTGQGLLVLSGHTDTVRGAVFSPDGKRVLTTSADHTARLWDASTGRELRRFEGHTDLVSRGAFFPDGKHILTTSYDGTARIWNIATGQTILTYTNQKDGHVNRVAFSPDGKTVATSADDGTARIWDPQTGRDTMIFKQEAGVTGLAFSPDGNYLVTCSFDGSLRLWEVTTGKAIRQFTGHPGGAFGAAFSPDGNYILTSGIDATVRLWDVQTGNEIRRFTGHMAEIREVSFSPDGKYILTASNDGIAQLWLADLDETIHAVCALLTRDLTPEEREQFGISNQSSTCPAQ
jgi:WD40 repeat protein/transcriptional regulator with XRE-family HTH domain